MKSLLLFLAGVLVGANVVYFVMRRDAVAPVAAPPVVATTPATPTPTGDDVVARAVPSPAPVAMKAPAPTAVVPQPSIPPPTPPPPNALLIPVAGIAAAQLTDTFNDTRDGTRRHEALDIMAARGTPVLAASDGTVAKLFTSVPGGLTIYEFDPTSTYAYYYAHLDHYAPGLSEGKVLKRGDLIAYVGSTGNASADAPHLHFAIFVLGPGKQWWKGTAIDPYPLLVKSR
ncbi:MAG TPA: M23 family metallopeptidase [Luteimonas sp.]|jgi:murein DD-endopeptidase MepM/ murein hydrolase activator NlpD|nr:M23 family metallopeptidase [Luteimonas sp.]